MGRINDTCGRNEEGLERHLNSEKIKGELFLGNLDLEGNTSVTMHVRD